MPKIAPYRKTKFALLSDKQPRKNQVKAISSGRANPRFAAPRENGSAACKGSLNSPASLAVMHTASATPSQLNCYWQAFHWIECLCC
jgi:hypothetical protein